MVDKFYIANRIKVENKNLTIKCNITSDICVVYSIWSNLNYAKYLYVSLLSQLKYTDFSEQCDYRIVIDVNIAESFFKYFGNIIPIDKVVIKETKECVKYRIPTYPELSNYKSIIICDSDTFFFNPYSTKISLYSILRGKLNNCDIIMERTEDKFEKIFYHRRPYLAKKFNTDTDYLHFFNDNLTINIDNFIDDYWNLSCLTAMNVSKFDTNTYTNFTYNAICKDIFCDETLFQWYSKYHHIHIHSLQVLPGIKWVTHLNKVDMVIDTLYIIHTIVGDNVYNTDIIELINEILK